MAQWLAYLLPDPSAPGFDSQHSRYIFRGKNVKVAEDNRRRCLEASEQWLGNIDRSYLVLASGKLVIEKKYC